MQWNTHVVGKPSHVRVDTPFQGSACGKVIITGEHAVVYGKHAIAVPVPLAVECLVRPRADSLQLLRIAPWGIDTWTQLQACPAPLRDCIGVIAAQMGVQAQGFDLDVTPHIPRGSGLGASAALAVAIARALAGAYGLQKSDAEINAVGFASEQVAHGKPSGVDNTVATYVKPLLFRKKPALMQPLQLRAPLALVIGFTGSPGMTLPMVAAVAKLREAQPGRVDGIMTQIDALTLAAKAALETGDWPALGAIMNANHELLTALGVSSPELESLTQTARAHGAVGAKLTGGGGGGAMVALCPRNAAHVALSIREAGFMAQLVEVA